MSKDKIKSNIDVVETIEYYSNKGYFIEVIADGYKLNGVGICWRGYVHRNQNNVWVSEDCGCLVDWIDAFLLTIDFIEKK